MIRANAGRSFLMRRSLVGVFLLAWGAWSLYDGLIAYPQQQAVAQEFASYEADGRLDDWPAYAQQQGYPVQPAAPPTDQDIFLQYLMAALTLPLGVAMLAHVYITSRRWIEADDAGLRTSGGQQASYAEVTDLDLSRWRSKGIAQVHYQRDSQEGRITLDDWRFDPKATEHIVRALEKHLAEQEGKPAVVEADEAQRRPA